MKHIAIVGAGIAGIYSALLCKTIRPDCRVSLIEQSDQLGGLLASKRFGDYEFDFGTHVPRLTGHEDIDNLLFANMDEQHWHRLDRKSVV